MLPDSSIADAVWAELGADAPRPNEAFMGGDARSRGWSALSKRSQLLGCFLLVAAIGGSGLLLVSTWEPSVSRWIAGTCCSLATVGGVAGGYLMAPRHRAAGLLGGAVAGIGSVGAAACVLEHSTDAAQALAVAAGVFGLLPGVAACVIVRGLLDRGAVWWRGNRARDTKTAFKSGFCPDLLEDMVPPPICVLYDPPPDVPNPQAGSLEEKLLHLCKEDMQLFRRLLDYERSRHPHLQRPELLRLAIQHFQRDIK